jgi:hypothetical protein
MTGKKQEGKSCHSTQMSIVMGPKWSYITKRAVEYLVGTIQTDLSLAPLGSG